LKIRVNRQNLSQIGDRQFFFAGVRVGKYAVIQSDGVFGGELQSLVKIGNGLVKLIRLVKARAATRNGPGVVWDEIDGLIVIDDRSSVKNSF
jgi:hypothetical protein